MFLHIGDTRIYQLNNKIVQLTEDHTYIARELKRVNITAEQAASDSRRNVLLQCIGVNNYFEPQIEAGSMAKNEGLLLCSDGFRHMVTEEELWEALQPAGFSEEQDMKDASVRLAETNMIKKLDHPALPRIVDIIDKKDVIYVVMDYIEGEPLSNVLAKHGAQPQERVIEWAKQLCRILDYLHTCDPPYEIYPIRYWNQQLSSGLERVVQKCTQLNPEDRYQTCAEVLYALNNYNEMDESYRYKQKRKMRSFVSVAAAGIMCLAVGMTCQVLKTQVNNSDYENILLQAEKSATSEEKEDYYMAAVDIKPAALEAYMGMIDAYKDDAVFRWKKKPGYR